MSGSKERGPSWDCPGAGSCHGSRGLGLGADSPGGAVVVVVGGVVGGGVVLLGGVVVAGGVLVAGGVGVTVGVGVGVGVSVAANSVGVGVGVIGSAEATPNDRATATADAVRPAAHCDSRLRCMVAVHSPGASTSDPCGTGLNPAVSSPHTR